MKFDKHTIVDLLKKQGADNKAAQADRDLPDRVDTDEDRGLLAKYGIDVEDLLARLPGDLGDKVDKLPAGLGKKFNDLL